MLPACLPACLSRGQQGCLLVPIEKKAIEPRAARTPDGVFCSVQSGLLTQDYRLKIEPTTNDQTQVLTFIFLSLLLVGQRPVFSHKTCSVKTSSLLCGSTIFMMVQCNSDDDDDRIDNCPLVVRRKFHMLLAQNCGSEEQLTFRTLRHLSVVV